MILVILAGIAAGTITGLTPGLHINLINTAIMGLAASQDAISLCSFILAMSITHTFVDAIPSIYLGAPDADHALSVLPGHRLLLQGQGHTAVLMTLVGSLGALISGVLLLPVAIFIIQATYTYIQHTIPYVLCTVALFMIARASNWRKRFAATSIFIFSGAIGCIVFALPYQKQPLFPLLSGLFGVSILLTSLRSDAGIPQQRPATHLEVHPACIISSVGMGFVAGFFPGFGASQAAIIASQWLKNVEATGFLVLTGGLNTANMIFSLATAYAIGKARNGSIVAILDILQAIDLRFLGLCACIALMAGGCAALTSMYLSRNISHLLPRLPYRALLAGIIIAITLMTCILGGWIGLMILITATSIGILAADVGKNYCIGCLMIPVILYLI